MIINSSGVIHTSSMNPRIPWPLDITGSSLERISPVLDVSSISSNVAGSAPILKFASRVACSFVPLNMDFVGFTSIPLMFSRYMPYSQNPCLLSQLIGKLLLSAMILTWLTVGCGIDVLVITPLLHLFYYLNGFLNWSKYLYPFEY